MRCPTVSVSWKGSAPTKRRIAISRGPTASSGITPNSMVEHKAHRRPLLRNHNGGRAPVSNLELFFDLVYVYAITQLSHTLLHHPTLAGLIQTTMLFLPVWWAWMFTTWAANWADPDRAPVRLMLIGGMLLSLVMAIAIPGAFADYALPFALGYVGFQT